MNLFEKKKFLFKFHYFCTSMNLDDFKSLITESAQAQDVVGYLQSSDAKISLNGLFGSYASAFIDAIIQHNSNTHLIVLNNKEEAAYFLNDIQSLNKKRVIIFYFFRTLTKNLIKLNKQTMLTW